jgi:hypothetical protein
VCGDAAILMTSFWTRQVISRDEVVLFFGVHAGVDVLCCAVHAGGAAKDG